MEASTLAITLLWSLLFVYSMLGSMDFGAGFWGMVYTHNSRTSAANIANRFLSPTWEVTNVFLVLFVVSLVTFFPFATNTLSSLLLIPVGLGLVLLTIRTTFMVFASHTSRYREILRITSGVTGLVIPALLVSVLPITLGGFSEMRNDGTEQLLYGKLLTHPTLYTHIAFGLTTELFISAVFLMDYAKEAKDWSAYHTYRKHSLWLGPVSIIIAVLTIGSMPAEASWLIDNIKATPIWFGLSIAFFLLGYGSLFIKKNGVRGFSRAAMVFIIIQYGIAIYAYGSAHLPYLIYPELTIESSFTNTTVFYKMLIVYGVGFSILIPAFYLFWRLFLKDQRYLKQQE
ncbi:cytochrome d ubiquinol oxidase subunit II [Halobacillus massiliensis]|uniref:cytochrome d ubiquinol oxidase subunit II n=1 Tax=Halobacillus massiliensis TaxID=1926286 RepID=UPI0009E3ABBD|nr:cytochrome d ubiquinol oxidase subunit II [Halobacillus massiliensis]